MTGEVLEVYLPPKALGSIRLKVYHLSLIIWDFQGLRIFSDFSDFLDFLESIIALNGVILQTGDYGAITIHRQNNSTAPARNS